MKDSFIDGGVSNSGRVVWAGSDAGSDAGTDSEAGAGQTSIMGTGATLDDCSGGPLVPA